MRRFDAGEVTIEEDEGRRVTLHEEIAFPDLLSYVTEEAFDRDAPFPPAGGVSLPRVPLL